jgi:hypothetical protein
MPMQEEPIVGAQYEDADGLTFEVTDFDVDEGVINVRYADDSVSEIDIDAWYELELRRRKADDDVEDSEETEEKPDEEDNEDDYDDNEAEQ